MLDLVFWTAEIVAVTCGSMMIVMGLRDEWAARAQSTDSATDDMQAA